MTGPNPIRVTLLVLYTSQLEECRAFYAGLGLDFVAEQHGQGPRHHAAVLTDGTVLELYPARPGRLTGALRLGLAVDGAAADPPLDAGHHQLIDPDGRVVEIHALRRSAVHQQPITVVTGGSRGIGAAICARLSADGHDIVLGYRADAAAAEAVASTVREAGRRCVAVRVDTTDEADVDRLFDAAEELGPVTGLVNNAGVSGPNGRLADADAAGMRRALEVNVLGYLLCARRAVRDMARNGGGAVVNISSAAATLGSPGQYVHYAAAKAAVDAMTVGLSKEVAADGIRVNCVAPGTIWTEFHEDPQRPAKIAASIPLGRAGRPEEIAGAVSWLLSADAGYATGTVLRVAGGL